MFNDFLLKSQGILLKTGCIYWGAVIDNEHCGLELPHYIVSCESCFAGLENGICLS